MDNVIVLHNSDGDVSLEVMSQEEFLKRLNSGWYGDEPKFATQEEAANLNYLDGKYVLIRGYVVQPKPVDVVKKYEL